MINLKSDIVFFGFGHMTSLIISELLTYGNKIICITDNPINLQKKREGNLRFMPYSELKNCTSISENTVFTWRDSSKINSPNFQTRNWLESNRFLTNKSFLLSSASVYKDSRMRQNESNRNLDLNKNEKYGLEQYLSSAMQIKNIHHLNLRISNVYGSGLHYGFINSILQSLKNKSEINVYNNTKIERDYIHIIDVIYALHKLMNLDLKVNTLNVSTGESTTIENVLEIFKNHGLAFDDINYIRKPKQIKFASILDPSALSKLIYWNPMKVSDGIQKCINMDILDKS